MQARSAEQERFGAAEDWSIENYGAPLWARVSKKIPVNKGATGATEETRIYVFLALLVFPVFPVFPVLPLGRPAPTVGRR